MRRRCPFCGDDLLGFAFGHGPHAGMDQVVCRCGARGSAAYSNKEAMHMWETRADDPLVKEMAQALVIANRIIGSKWKGGPPLEDIIEKARVAGLLDEKHE